MNVAYQVLRNYGHYMRTGLLHSFGAIPHSIGANAAEFEWFGRALKISTNSLMPEVGGGAISKGAAAASSIPLLLTLANIGSGFASEGAIGGARSALWDVGVNAALVHHAYTVTTNDVGKHIMTEGRFIDPKLLKRFGRVARGAGTASNFVDFSARYFWGSTMAHAFGNALGGGVLGSAGALIGGSLGVRYAGKLTLAAGGYYLGKTVARGPYSLLKAGYNHQQMRKSINTDGDMASFMTSGAFSMRERAVQAIQRSHLNARSALGNEASLFHQAQRNYSSPYRQY